MLRLPSVVFMVSLSSLKVMDSLTAKALKIPRRRRSCIKRSRCGSRSSVVFAPRTPLKRAPPVCSDSSARLFRPRSFKSALPLATVPPCDDDAENYVQQAEASEHVYVAPRRRAKERERAQEHKRETH